jgi:hypothetical protein
MLEILGEWDNRESGYARIDTQRETGELAEMMQMLPMNRAN